MIWAKRGMQTRVIGTEGKGGVSIFIFIIDTGNVFNVHDNIGQSQFKLVLSSSTNFVVLLAKSITFNREIAIGLIWLNIKHIPHIEDKDKEIRNGIIFTNKSA